MLGTYQSKEGLHKSTRWNVKPMHKTYASLDPPHEDPGSWHGYVTLEFSNVPREITFQVLMQENCGCMH